MNFLINKLSEAEVNSCNVIIISDINYPNDQILIQLCDFIGSKLYYDIL